MIVKCKTKDFEITVDIKTKVSPENHYVIQCEVESLAESMHEMFEYEFGYDEEEIENDKM